MSDQSLFKPRKLKFKAWDTESRLLMRLDSINCNKGELMKKNHILLQFTGILDKNGDEIYEMDVLLIADQKFAVSWDDEKNGWFYCALNDPANREVFLASHGVSMVRLGNLFELG